MALLRQNVRTPDQTLGDLWAQVVALDVMEERLLHLMRGHGLWDLADLAAEIQGRCEAAMRAAIAALPDGTYRSELQTDGLMDTPITSAWRSPFAATRSRWTSRAATRRWTGRSTAPCATLTPCACTG